MEENPGCVGILGTLLVFALGDGQIASHVSRIAGPVLTSAGCTEIRFKEIG